jgi:hypothetical protein
VIYAVLWVLGAWVTYGDIDGTITIIRIMRGADEDKVPSPTTIGLFVVLLWPVYAVVTLCGETFYQIKNWE